MQNCVVTQSVHNTAYVNRLCCRAEIVYGVVVREPSGLGVIPTCHSPPVHIKM